MQTFTPCRTTAWQANN